MEKVMAEGFYSLFKNLGGIEDKFIVAFISSANLSFLPARRYASAGNSDRNVSVRPSVCPSVRHAPVLCQNEES